MLRAGKKKSVKLRVVVTLSPATDWDVRLRQVLKLLLQHSGNTTRKGESTDAIR